MTEKFEKIEERSDEEESSVKELDTQAGRADVIGAEIIEGAISKIFMEKLEGNINQDEFNRKVAQIFGVVAVDVKEVKTEDGSVGKLEIRDKSNNEILAYFDIEGVDRFLDEEDKLETDRSVN
ncbi:MAG: hypothetical protein COV29_01815 [Candidatus Yanofskybacteria bacterium CG10_big_fil_rev_8_21_14_0_10_36_16]|uniref:Uncharacterized protein n=1 Tax=Candidatus Yanofskybacteria bacterium CG10_big_fil_rev_8_21_14_0_10_36_16 TaxID=1975096 RepID=A0A2J0Q7E4_9BACT|nr:MAG: hypothetical protein COV29_01815 [Candidatus Yanofskybacteria bacterium CG10_big_fil_rev_8_21_14_0_10_36_16]